MRAAHEEVATERTFEGAHASPQRGTADAEGACRAGESTRTRNGKERSEVVP